MEAPSGNAREAHILAIRKITRTPVQLPNPIQVLFVATDGDKWYTSAEEAQFAQWFPCYWANGLSECFNIIKRLAPFFIADFLHLAKNVRSRILTYIPILQYQNRQIPIEGKVMEEILHLDPVFTDRSNTGKMTDSYPLALFRLPHVITLFRAGRCGEAVYLLPWILAMIAFRSDAISKSTRIFLLELTLALFAKLYADLLQEGHGLKEQGTAGDRVCPLKRITLIRAMETIIGLIHALVVLDCDVPLDRMSTHPLENFFGLLRRLLNDCNKFDELLHAAARNAVVTEIYHSLDHPRDVCGRDNEGEIVSRTDGDRIETPVLTVQQAFQSIWSTLQLSNPSEMEFPARAIEEMESLLS
jgi:hypothetical protein